MDVTQQKEEGLKREFQVVIPATEIAARLEARLLEIGKTAKIAGFRPGKIPLPILQKRYESNVRSEILEKVTQEATDKILVDRNIRPATRPKRELLKDQAGKDVLFSLTLEIMPEIPPIQVESLKIEKIVSAPTPELTEKTLQELAEKNPQLEELKEKRSIQKGDVVIVDLEDTLGEKGIFKDKKKDFPVALGSGKVLKEFEEALIGKEPGDHFTLPLTFPNPHPIKELSGKTSTFNITIKSLGVYKTPALDDAFAKSCGLKTFEELKKTIENELQKEYDRGTFLIAKREILDQLDTSYQIEVPPTLVDIEFQTIWEKVEQENAVGETPDSQASPIQEIKEGSPKPESTQKISLEREDILEEHLKSSLSQSKIESLKKIAENDPETLKKEYRGIAERRVKLGLLLSQIGQKYKIGVTQKELENALFAHALQYPGHEKEVVKLYRNTPAALDTLRAPIFEDKVIHLILDKAQVTSQTVSVEELKKKVQNLMEGDE